MRPRLNATSWLAGLTLAGLLAVLPACKDPISRETPSDAGSLELEPDAPGVVACFPVPNDTDGDRVADTSEGAPSVDTDADGTPDYKDDDSDGDGISDAMEAGGDNPCTPPHDADGDDIGDFRETDSDDNGVVDGAEPKDDLDGDGQVAFQDRDDDGDGLYDKEELGPDKAHPRDSDQDGIVDYQDTDSDGDGIPDLKEGRNDPDGDGKGAYLDDDSDGDHIPDRIEGGEDPAHPLDSDHDSMFDFLDTDSDNDGLADSQEDVNSNGRVDPGESDPHLEDTDSDSYPDVVEWAAKTDPTDAGSKLSEDDFYFVLPYYDAEKDDVLDFSTDINKADVLFECDTTGSMGGTISTLQTQLENFIVPQIHTEIPNVAMGAAWFKDFPASDFGDSADLPFKLTQRITTNIDSVQQGLDQFSASGGSDLPEAGIEAFYQAVTGEGVSWSVDNAGSVPKFRASVGYDPAQGHGLLGGAGFRAGSLPIVVHATDAESHDAPDYFAAGIGAAHSRTQAVQAAIAFGARFIGITSDATARAQLEQIARETGTVVSPKAWGPTETFCHTGTGGSPLPPDATGLCPLVFDMDFGGGGVDQQVVDAIKALVTFGTIDISAVPLNDSLVINVETSRFITTISPVPPAPAGAAIDGDVFRAVQPGSPVRFRVRARNTIVESRREAQIFRTTIRVMGDMVTTLDERDVFVVVPGGGFDP